MVEFLNPIAELEEPDSGKVVLADQAYELKDKIKFYCPDYDCKDSNRILIVKKSNKGNYFFSHKPECGHDIRPETLLHKLAIKWFLDKEEFELPLCKLLGQEIKIQKVKIDKSKTECEFRKLERIIPDVKLTTNQDFTFAIEIVVTNDINEIKAKLIKEFNLPTVRINLTNFYLENKDSCRGNFDFIQAKLPALLTDIKLKSWVIAPNYDSIINKLELTEPVISKKTESNLNKGCFTVLTGVGIFLLIRRLLK